MITLLYYKDGFLKKFALNKHLMTVGRGNENDLVIDEPFVSRKHLEIEVSDDHILIRDLKSTNGTYFDGLPIETAVLKIGDSFSFKGIDFFVQKGYIDEFEPAKELVPIFDAIRKKRIETIEQIETKNIENTYNKILEYLLSEGLKNQSIHELLTKIAPILESSRNFGSMMIVSENGTQKSILFSVRKHKNLLELFEKSVHQSEADTTITDTIPTPEKDEEIVRRFPFKMGKLSATMYYFPLKNHRESPQNVINFLNILAKELEVLSKLNSSIPAPTLKPENGNDKSIITVEPDMERLVKQISKIAKSDIFVLIEGESGTGKELFARLIHQQSKRGAGEFIAINCAAIPAHLLESELFGYERGAFTGATTTKKGKLEMASGGTLVLDEISEMPLELQAKLLRALEENSFYRLGGLKTIKVDLRIVSLTNKSLQNQVEKGLFREDLYYRLVHHTVRIPPLRERPADISPLIEHFTHHLCLALSKHIQGYSVRAFQVLRNYSWPGNVRQLKNEINRLVNLTDEGECIDYDLLSENIRQTAVTNSKTPVHVSENASEKEKLTLILDQCKGSRIQTARALGISTQALWKKMKKFNVS